MQREKRKTERISVLARCSSVIILVLILASKNPCYALSVSGVPKWLESAVTRSLNAVWQEIPVAQEIDREGTLAIVATRLFAGYDIAVKSNRNGPAILFTPQDVNISPVIKLNVPELRGMALEWFSKDIEGMSEEIFALVENLPQSAFTWADEELRKQVGEIVNNKLPGWEFSQQIYISKDSTLINISFRPSSAKLILAIKPALYSHTVPVMIRSYLEAKLIPAFSPLIGVPVKWAEYHKTEIEKFANEFLEDRHSVENLRADVSVIFIADTVSSLEARVDSKDLMFQMWVAAYAGLEGRYPETGAFFGFRPDIWLKPEIYVEAVFSLNNFDLINRVGGRFELVNNFWVGVENQWPDNEYFFRVQYIPLKIRRPYAWWRFSPELEEHEAALGYRFDEHVSLEIYYGEDKIGLKGLWHL